MNFDKEYGLQGSPDHLASKFQQSSNIIIDSSSYVQTNNNRENTTQHHYVKKKMSFDNIFEPSHFERQVSLDFAEDQGEKQVECNLADCMQSFSKILNNRIFSIICFMTLSTFLATSILEISSISDQVQQISNYIELCCQIFFSFGIVVKIIFKHEKQTFWIALDVITNIAGYLGLAAEEFSQEAERYFKAIRTLRLLFFIKQSIYLNLEANNLINSLKSVGKILFPAAMFIFLYAVVGLYAFRDYQYSRCRDPSNKYLSSNWTVYTGSVYLCGQMSCPTQNGIAYECLNPIDYGVTPTQSELLSINFGNGLMRYNNIFHSLLSTFKQTFVTGSSRLMILQKQVTNQFFVLLYYLSFIYLLSYLYLNIFYGLMLSNEEDENLKNSLRSWEGVQIKIKNNSGRKSNQLEGQASNQLKTSNKGKQQKTSKLARMNSTAQPQDMHRTSNCQSIMHSPMNQLNQIKEESSQFSQIINFQKKSTKRQLTRKTRKPPTKIVIAFQNDNDDILQKKIKCSQSMSNFSYQTQNQEHKKYYEMMKKYYIVNHVLVTLCAINIILDYEGQSIEFQFISDCIDFGFYCLYLLELLWRVYIHQKYAPEEPFEKLFKADIVLFLLVTSGIVYEAIIAEGAYGFFNAQTGISSAIRCLKYFRLVFVVMGTPYFKEARIIINSTFQAVFAVRYFTLLWLLCLLIFSIMGVHMFQDKTKVDSSGNLDLSSGSAFPISFQGIYNGIIFTIFVFFNQQWDYFMFQQYLGSGFVIVIWQLFTICLGLTILSKYFMALLMKELGDRLDQQAQQNTNQDQIKQNQLSIMSSTKQIFNSNKVSPVNQLQNIAKIQQHKQVKPSDIVNRRISFSGLNAFNAVSSKSRRVSRLRQTIEGNFRQKEKTQIKFEETSKFKICSFYLTLILKNPKFTAMRCGVVLLSSISTALVNPQTDPASKFYNDMSYVFMVTDTFFALQVILSMVAYGIIFDKKSYFRRSYMNWINITISVIQLVNYIPGTSDGSTLDHLLCLRVLRIFVFIQLKYFSDRDMRLTMVAFTKLLPKIVNLLLITNLMYGFFAIILVKLYKNDFYYCDSYYSSETILTKQDCFSWGGNWIQRKMNVSDFLNSVLYLFLVATTEGWSTQVIEAASIRGQNNQPIFGQNLQIQAFFAAFFFFGNMIMLNVFIGLSLYNFKKIKQEVIGQSRLTKDQKIWLSIKSQIFRLKPNLMDEPPSYFFGSICHKVTHSFAYKVFNLIFFVLFLINMCLFQSNQSQLKEQILTIILYVFYGIFCVQYIMDWFSYGLRIVKQKKFLFETLGFFYAIALIIILNTSLNQGISSKQNRILHAAIVSFLAIRYFSLIKDIQFVRKTINSLITILPQTYNILLLIVIILFVYSVIGMELFSYLKVSSQLNSFDQNYISLDKAMYALIKFSTMQSPIGQIIDAASQIGPNSVCFQINSYADFQLYGRMGCGSPIKSYLFFLSFHLIYSLILMSTLMAVIFDGYSEVRRQEESMVNKFQLQQVQNEWSAYDPEATGYISYRDFWMFTAKLMKIYNVNKQEIMSHQSKQTFLKSLNIPIYEDEHGVLSFQFHEVIEALTRIVLNQKAGKTLNTEKADQLFKVKQEESHRMKKSFYDSSHVLTLIMLKSGLKVWRKKANNGDGMIKALLKQAKIKKQMAQLQKKNTNPDNFLQQIDLTVKKQKVLLIDKINFQNEQSHGQLKVDKSTKHLQKAQNKKSPFQIKAKSAQRSKIQIIEDNTKEQQMQIQKMQLDNYKIQKKKQAPSPSISLRLRSSDL